MDFGYVYKIEVRTTNRSGQWYKDSLGRLPDYMPPNGVSPSDHFVTPLSEIAPVARKTVKETRKVGTKFESGETNSDFVSDSDMPVPIDSDFAQCKSEGVLKTDPENEASQSLLVYRTDSLLSSVEAPYIPLKTLESSTENISLSARLQEPLDNLQTSLLGSPPRSLLGEFPDAFGMYQNIAFVPQNLFSQPVPYMPFGVFPVNPYFSELPSLGSQSIPSPVEQPSSLKRELLSPVPEKLPKRMKKDVDCAKSQPWESALGTQSTPSPVEQPSSLKRELPSPVPEEFPKKMKKDVDCAKNGPCVKFDGITNESELRATVLKLDGSLADIPREATHLVMESFLRTPNLLAYISSVQFVVSTDWIMESEKQGRFVDEEPFLLRDKSVEEMFGFDLKLLLSKPDRISFLKTFTIQSS